MQTIDAINTMLIAAGEAIVSEVDGTHPLEGSLLHLLEEVSRLEQSKGWWFNEYATTLEPDVNQNLPVPTGASKVMTAAHAGRRLVQRGGFMMDWSTRSLIFDRPVQVRVTEHWEFEELPETFAKYVTAMAALQAGMTYDSDAARVQALASAVELARSPMMKEHIDNVRTNMLDTPSMLGKQVNGNLRRYGVR